jgi:hypothetical protein
MQAGRQLPAPSPTVQVAEHGCGACQLYGQRAHPQADIDKYGRLHRQLRIERSHLPHGPAMGLPVHVACGRLSGLTFTTRALSSEMVLWEVLTHIKTGGIQVGASASARRVGRPPRGYRNVACTGAHYCDRWLARRSANVVSTAASARGAVSARPVARLRPRRPRCASISLRGKGFVMRSAGFSVPSTL